MVKRYTRTGFFGASYYDVVCPKCKKDAIVSFTKKDGYYYQWHQRRYSHLTCNNCGYKEAPGHCVLYDASVNVYCPDCGIRNTVERKGLTVTPQTLDVVCSKCKARHSYKPTITTTEIQQDSKGLKTDPMFNYPLWLQTTVAGNLFWAYNREHLEEIRLYVEADLREKNHPYLMTMVARLPTFIKIAKNREKILATIDKLKQI